MSNNVSDVATSVFAAERSDLSVKDVKPQCQVSSLSVKNFVHVMAFSFFATFATFSPHCSCHIE